MDRKHERKSPFEIERKGLYYYLFIFSYLRKIVEEENEAEHPSV